ncbi:MAG: DUF2490 domain-containing protein [Sulfurovum sp.]|nr:DUF2490 domain-containing protein [Sulfurovum sp.]
MSAGRDLKILTYKISIFMLSILFFISFPLHAQEKEKLLVLEVYPQWYSENDFTIQGNIGTEKELEHNNWFESYLSPSMTYALDHNWALHGGLGVHYKYYDDSDNRWEVRPFVGVSHYYPWTEKWKTSSYFRVEERYFKYLGDEASSNNTRMRFRLRSDYIFNPLSLANTWHRFTMSIEGLKSEESDLSIQEPDLYAYETRVTLGMERSLEKQEKIRFELSLISRNRPSESSASSVQIIYFKLKYYPLWGLPVRNKLFQRNIEE